MEIKKIFVCFFACYELHNLPGYRTHSCGMTGLAARTLSVAKMLSFFFISFVRLLALRPLLAYCASLG
jgi:hypothetical protein